MNAKKRKISSIGLALSLLAAPLSGLLGQSAAWAAADSLFIPPLSITELVQDTSNVTNSSGTSVDGYEYIELYNNSSAPIPLKGYKIIYNTTSTWNLDKDMTIQPHDAMVLWVQSPGLSGSVETFNANYGSNIRPDQFYPISGQGLSNSGSRTLILANSEGFKLSSVSYSDGTGADDDVVLNKSVIYSYPTDGTIVMRKTANQQTPTPGRIVAGQAPDESAPIPPKGLFAIPGDRSSQLFWTASENPNVVGYQVIVNGVLDGTVIQETSYKVTGLTNFTENKFAVVAVTGTQMSIPSEVVKSTPRPEIIDSIPPDAPTGTAAAINGIASVHLSWSPNTESDVASYKVYKNGAYVTTVSSSTYSADLGSLSGGFEYKLQVSAVDSSANESAKSQPVTITLPHQPLTQEETGAPIVGDTSAYQRFLNVSEPGPIVPGLLQGLVPQGMHYIKEKNWAIISSYRDDRRASTLTIVDLQSGSLVKTIHLYKNGQPFTGHAGGVAVSDQNVWIAYGKELLRLSLQDVIDSPDNANLSFIDSFKSNTRASFASYSDGVLWVGDYYSSPNYLTTPIQKMTTRDNKVYNAWIVGYKLDEATDLLPADSKLTSDGLVIPDYIYSVTDRIQGVTVTDDEVMLSQTNGNPKSNILKYKASVKEAPHTTVTIENTTVPVWFLDGLNMEDSLDMPPSAEGNFINDNKLYILYESGANIYRPDINYPLDRVQIVELKAWEQYDHIAIEGPSVPLIEQQTGTLKVQHFLGEKGTFDVTSASLLSSSDPSVATITNAGEIAALRAGDTVISANYNGKTASYIIKVVPENVALLSRLSVNNEPVTGFDPQKQSYTKEVAHSTDSIRLQTALVSSKSKLSGITVQRNGTVTDVTYTVSGAVYQSGSVNLTEGANVFSIRVTAADGTTVSTYTLTVNRHPLPAPPSGLEAEKGHREAILHWNASKQSDVIGYSVYQDGKKLTRQPIKQTKYKITGLPNGKKHHFSVTTVNQFNEESAPTTIEVKLKGN
ncbi:cadherin-like beta sandwich domain-containing protein [Paenibacillus sp. RC67]|uniref:fibronectin type III domain-containing protein n=1 Tax=Paenibacillus sp. RC67 TaxID=3039392 RepID=UPI0024AD0C10|nr:cadherin-like beta sandwich domain-containing protein [Paenibacillus sp. RC67]